MWSPKLHIKLFGKQLHTFHFFGVMGFILGALLGMWLAQQKELSVLVVIFLSCLGAAIFFGLVYLAKWITGSETIVYYHHEITIMLLSSLALWLLGLPVLPYLDIVILGIATFLSFGRVGCYSVGCCHGKPHKWGVCYSKEHVSAGFTWYYENINLFPIQLLESITVMLAVVTGVILMLNGVTPGTILIFYTITYGMFRYIVEYFRGDPERPLFMGLSEAQLTSLSLALVTFLLSIPGWLPYYDWHLYVLVLMIVSTIVTAVIYRKTYFGLLMPRHINEIAEGLRLLDHAVTEKGQDGVKTVNIYTTKKGLCISCNMKGEQINHCTISLESKVELSSSSVKKIAYILSQLKNNGRGFKIVHTSYAVYHILFEPGFMKEKFINEVA